MTELISSVESTVDLAKVIVTTDGAEIVGGATTDVAATTAEVAIDTLLWKAASLSSAVCDTIFKIAGEVAEGQTDTARIKVSESAKIDWPEMKTVEPTGKTETNSDTTDAASAEERDVARVSV